MYISQFWEKKSELHDINSQLHVNKVARYKLAIARDKLSFFFFYELREKGRNLSLYLAIQFFSVIK